MGDNKIHNIKRLILILFALVVTCIDVAAQQDPLYSQYNNSLLTINPAYAGSRGMLNVMGITRRQWVSFSGAPQTQALMVQGPLKYYNMGLGGSIMQDNSGPTKQVGLFFDYSYKIDLLNSSLAFGLKAGVTFYDINLSDLETNESGDPSLSTDITRSFLPNFGIGVLYYSDKYYLGLSAPKLIRNTISKDNTETEHLNKEEVHLFFMGGYVFDINRILKFKPYVTSRIVWNAPLSTDLAAQFIFYDRFWVGAQYRIGDAMGGMMQMQVTDQLRIGYSYDFSTNDLQEVNNGTHEILISFDFNFGADRVRSPRYF